MGCSPSRTATSRRSNSECELPVPPEVLKQLEASETNASRTEWALRCIPPARLSPLQNRTLIRRDVRFHRAKAGVSPPGYVEALLAYLLRASAAPPPLGAMWQLTRRRFQRCVHRQTAIPSWLLLPRDRWTMDQCALRDRRAAADRSAEAWGARSAQSAAFSPKGPKRFGDGDSRQTARSSEGSDMPTNRWT